MSADDQDKSADTRGLWRRVIAAPEGGIFLTGVVVAVLYLVGMGLTWRWSGTLFQSLFTMTTTHVLAGRAAGISWGYAHDLRPWLVIGANLAIEAILVMLFFPLFVLSYHKLIIIAPLKDAMVRVQRAAQARQAQIMKYGIPGLLLFVWFPFWMTGPIVGSVIGFLIGLRPWVNMAVVLAGTGLATLCWGFALERLHTALRGLGHYVPLVFVGAILLVAISIHIRYAFSKHAQGPEGGEAERREESGSQRQGKP